MGPNCISSKHWTEISCEPFWVVSVFPKNHSRYGVVDGLMHEEAVALFKRFYARENRAGASTKSSIWINTVR